MKDHRLYPAELNYVSRDHTILIHACDTHWAVHVTGEVLLRPALVSGEHINVNRLIYSFIK